MEESTNVRIMKIIKDFDYLVKIGESITIKELKNRAESVPGIMDEPYLQFISHSARTSDISTITRNNMGYWYEFKKV